MAIQINRPPAETAERIRQAISEAFPDAEVEATGIGGHFEIRVVSGRFAGHPKLARQRMVYRCITELMQGDQAPVHAVDRLETLTPDEV